MAERGRPKLPLGTYGEIAVWPAAHSTPQKPVYVARARFRDSDGHTRPVARSGQTQTAAKNALREALSKRQKVVAKAAVTSTTTVGDLAAAWLEQGAANWSTNTQERYALAVKQILVQVGGVRMQELSRSTINTALKAIQAGHGSGSAASAKSALSGMCKLALLYDAIDVNPVRDAITIGTGRKDRPRALTVDEVEDLTDRLRSNRDAVERYDLADLVDFMLGTGCRIGEACAAREKSIDRATGTWEINATAVRVRGVGMVVQERPKTAAGWRILALPPYVVGLLERRSGELSMSSQAPVVFGSPHVRAIRDPSNTAADLRLVLDELGYQWVTSHTFRRTVATRLDEAGLSGREVADQLGHSKPSMTQDKYMGRGVVTARAATVLER